MLVFIKLILTRTKKKKFQTCHKHLHKLLLCFIHYLFFVISKLGRSGERAKLGRSGQRKEKGGKKEKKKKERRRGGEKKEWKRGRTREGFICELDSTCLQ
jgi:hypothetical protein